MESDQNPQAPTPPHLIRSLSEGFNTVANNIHLILLPVLLDLFLWLGPHLRIKDAVQPLWEQYLLLASKIGNSQSLEIIKTNQEIWGQILDQFNLFSLLRSYPIGVSSLVSSLAPVKSPLGEASWVDISSISTVSLLWLLFALLGLLAGCVYFSAVARRLNTVPPIDTHNNIFNIYFQIILLTLGIILLIMILSIPFGLLLAFIAIISPGIAQVAFFVIGLFLLWMLLPLIFSPHGIVYARQNVVAAVVTSARMVRIFLPGTGTYLLCVLLISQGMDILWRIPSENSWMLLIGILGHAFISTGLLSSSFSYYSGGIRWMQAHTRRVEQSSPAVAP